MSRRRATCSGDTCFIVTACMNKAYYLRWNPTRIIHVGAYYASASLL